MFLSRKKGGKSNKVVKKEPHGATEGML